MKKLIVTGMAVAMLAVPASSMAASPTSNGWQMKANTTYTDLPNDVAIGDAQITHNGWSVGGNKHFTGSDSVWSGGDQTTAPGSRADLVQSALGH